MMKSTENRLITLEPGEYLRAGADSPTMLRLTNEAQGLVVKSVSDPHGDANFLTVLVNGQLVNVWHQLRCDR
jgi:aerobic-type carbon monoxide dehydrogenase small subunit (CoxS/CutS family)